MSSEAWLATRKGLFKVDGSDSDWKIVGRSFGGDNVSIVTVGVSIGGVYVTRDGGESLKAMCSGLRAEYVLPEQAEDSAAQDPHLIAPCAAEPDTIWTQHHNGVFVTRNGCVRWEKIDPSTFGFAVAVHPKDGNMAWLVLGIKDELRIPVDGKFVVTKTTDGGKSWKKLSNGLPKEDFWVSEDAG